MTGNATEYVPQPSWFRRVVRLLLVFVLVLAAAGFLYENISEARDRRFNPMLGERVEIRGGIDRPSFKMHIYCSGQGTPVVVLDAGLGDSYVTWQKVQPQIAKFTRVCSYDRAGMGYSDSSPQARSSQSIADELQWLLLNAYIPSPYILVGHSMGGYDVRVFASEYRNEVAGMVLVDAAHPDQENRFPPKLRAMERSWQREAEFLEYTMPFGIPRLIGFCDDDPVVRAAECNFHTARETVAEIKLLPKSAAETAATPTLGDLPLAVLSRDPDKPSADLPADVAESANQAWEKMQEELAHLSTRGTHTIAKNSAHYIQDDRPDVVVEAVQAVLDQARAGPSASAVKR